MVIADTEDGVIRISQNALIGLQGDAGLLKRAPTRIQARQGGQYLSRFKGRGMEFEEARPYQAGDDIRNMDWRVTARSGKPHSKVFREERERPVLLWVDFRKSMFFGSRVRFKSVQAARLAALLAWRATHLGDRLGGLLFSEGRHLEMRPGRGKRAVLRMIRELSGFSDGEGASHGQQVNHDADHALNRLVHVTRPGSLVYLISDFRRMDRGLYSALARLGRHNEVVLLHVHDQLEQQLPGSGQYRVTDGLVEAVFDASDRQARLEYPRRFEQQQQWLKHLSRSTSAHYLAVATHQDLREVVKPLSI